MSQPNYQGPGTYRHYKGGRYDVLGLALREETVDKSGGDQSNAVRVVIYRPLTAGTMLGKSPFQDVEFWERSLDDFNASVYQPGGIVPRFTFEGAGAHD